MFVLFFFATFCATCSAENTIFRNLVELFDLVKYTEHQHILTAPELISNYGYTAEIHNVTTDDGYILEMHRIPATPTSPAAKNKSIVFLMHGILSSSLDWILTGRERSFAFIYADAGYDVWMGNARGTIYSLGHKEKPHISNEAYWRFSWHEIGYYDLPAMIDYALATTGHEQLTYIGHSQGTTAFYVMTSMRTEYNDKVKVMFSLAPIAYIKNAAIPYKSLAVAVVDVIPILLKLLHFYYVPPATQLTTALATILCNDESPTQFICTSLVFSAAGIDEVHLNTTILPIIFSHFPSGASTMQFVHYMQEMKSGRFCQYDYGVVRNLVEYGTLSPPAYNLGKITAPVILIYSGQDFLSSAQDVDRLYDELGNAVSKNRVNATPWNHIDFLWGIGAKQLIMEPILQILRNKYP